MPAEPTSPPPIVVMPGPHGLIIASEDTEALDEFERLLDMLAGQRNEQPQDQRVLSQVRQGHGRNGDTGANHGRRHGERRRRGECRRRRRRQPDGRMFGGPFGGFGGGGSAVAAAADAADRRQAPATPRTGAPPRPRRSTLRPAERAWPPARSRSPPTSGSTPCWSERTAPTSTPSRNCLKVLDQKDSPEDISVATKPRMIAVENSNAQEIADIVKQVYADRMVENPNANQTRRHSSAMMARAQETSEPSIEERRRQAVDRRRSAHQLADRRRAGLRCSRRSGNWSPSSTRRRASRTRPSAWSPCIAPVPTAIEEALAAIAGSSVQVSRTTPPPATARWRPYQPFSQPATV